MVEWRKNYDQFEQHNEEMKNHVDAMYKLVNEYAKENGIIVTYNDMAERFVEAIATYIVDSSKCPRCGAPLNPIKVRNALSRKDNKTYVCNDCGTHEALTNEALLLFAKQLRE